MTDHLPNPGLLFYVLFLVVPAAKGLRSGRLKSGAQVYDRDGQPVEFWCRVAYAALGLAMVAWHVAELPADPSDHVILAGFFYIVGLPMAYMIIHALRTGTASLGRSTFGRETTGGRYWALLLGYAALLIASLWFPLEWSTRRSTSYAAVVEPVVQRVRYELREEGSVPFRNVRVDQQSRHVCGEAVLDGTPLRFVGRAIGDAATADVDDASLLFERAHRRLCGAPGVVPSTG